MYVRGGQSPWRSDEDAFGASAMLHPRLFHAQTRIFGIGGDHAAVGPTACCHQVRFSLLAIAACDAHAALEVVADDNLQVRDFGIV